MLAAILAIATLKKLGEPRGVVTVLPQLSVIRRLPSLTDSSPRNPDDCVQNGTGVYKRNEPCGTVPSVVI